VFQRTDSCDEEIKTGSPVALIFEGPVADFTEAVKEHCPGERVARFALVEPGVRPPPQSWVADPVECKEGAFKPSYFPKRSTGPRMSSTVNVREAERMHALDSQGPNREEPVDCRAAHLLSHRNEIDAARDDLSKIEAARKRFDDLEVISIRTSDSDGLWKGSAPRRTDCNRQHRIHSKPVDQSTHMQKASDASARLS